MVRPASVDNPLSSSGESLNIDSEIHKSDFEPAFRKARRTRRWIDLIRHVGYHERRGRFTESQPGLPGIGSGWRGARVLGKGGQGIAGLWVRINESRQIVDRMVVKEAFLQVTRFSDPRIWKNGVLYSVPREAYHTELVNTEENDRPGSTSYNVTLLGSSVQEHLQTYRIYLGYCPGGSLWRMAEHQTTPKVFRIHQPNGRLTAVIRDAHEQIPEPAIWYLFLNLATAVMNMKHPPKLPPNAPQGSNIVHIDIKPANIFLDTNHPTRWPKYSVAKVGDFGSAVLTYPGDPHNPREFWKEPRTKGFISPEQFRDPRASLRLGPWTNIYQIGIVIWTMMEGGLRNPDQIRYNDDQGRHLPDFGNVHRKYSRDLIYLVRSCVVPWPEHRLTPERLLQRLMILMPAHTENMHDVRAMGSDTKNWLHYELTDLYRVGMTVR